ncbi:MAG: aspartate/glutamate racemase family protein [Caldimonas sp.]
MMRTADPSLPAPWIDAPPEPLRIALIHATRLAIEPVREAFERGWPEARCFNLLEDSLPGDRARLPDRAPVLTERFVALSRYARTAGASAILYTCSAFGPEIEAAREAVALPTLKPNEAMFVEALTIGRRIGLLATFKPSIAPMRDELVAMARKRGLEIEVRTVWVDHAFAALDRGDLVAHDTAIAEAARRLSGIDVVLLAQFSMARARALVQQSVAVPVLASPDSAVRRLRELLLPAAPPPPSGAPTLAL